MAPKVSTLSQEEFAAAVGRTSRTVMTWRQKGMPVRMISGRPRYVLRDCLTWWEESIREEERDKSKGTSNNPEIRKTAAEADLKELDLAVKRRELVPLEEYQAALDKVIGGFAAVASGRLQQFEREIVAAQTPGDARRITQAIYHALMEGANEFADHTEGVTGPGEAETAA
ncbi:MAG TPA: hypothetical protein VJN95_08640 [Gemmatimonadales bacterium]|nr:hypothetical protein [Gemmatimonadales bacterium]